MKGAIAEPLVSTMRPPRASIMISDGTSQNFLRARTKLTSSLMIDISSLLELLCERLRRRPCRRARDPVGGVFLVPFQSQRIFAEEAHEKPRRQHRAEEYDRHDHRRHDLAQCQ